MAHDAFVLCAADQRQTQREQIQHGHLHAVRLGAGDGNLRPGVGVQNPVGRAGDGRTNHVHHSKCFCAALPGKLQCGQRIQSLAALADDDHQIVFAKDGVPVAEFTGDVYINGHAGDALNGGLADHAGVHGCAAGNDVDILHSCKVFVRQSGHAQRGQAVLYARIDCGAQGLRLLVDLLEHKVRITAFFGSADVPVGREVLLLHRMAESVVYVDLIRAQHSDLALFQHRIIEGIAQQSGNVAGEKVFSGAVTDYQRAFLAHGEDLPGKIFEQDGEPVAAAHLLQRPQDGVQRFAVIVVVQQLYQHLGVCFAAEFIASFHKVLLELGVVFNDAVVHQADARGAMGMAVYVAGGAVRSPACVPDAAVRGHGRHAVQFFCQNGQPALCFDDPDLIVYAQCDSG